MADAEIPPVPNWERPLDLNGAQFKTGEKGVVDIPVGHLITHEMLHLTVHVFRGRKPGPRLFVCAALHGDEINGVEIVRRLLGMKQLRYLRGDLLAIPVVNRPAFLARSRYLPDRRDLNRLFPGSFHGSFGARLARVFLTEIVKKCTHGIDLHTGAVNRPNLPQIRFSGDQESTLEMARAFHAPVMIESPVRPGSLREAMAQKEKPILMYEAGEATILDPASVRVGLRGVTSVMRHLGMLAKERKPPKKMPRTMLSKETWWERAPRGGIFMPRFEVGRAVGEGTVLGTVGDPFSGATSEIVADREGIIIGRAKQALIDEGDGLFHIALTRHPERAERAIVRSGEELDERYDHPVFDDPLLE